MFLLFAIGFIGVIGYSQNNQANVANYNNNPIIHEQNISQLCGNDQACINALNHNSNSNLPENYKTHEYDDLLTKTDELISKYNEYNAEYDALVKEYNLESKNNDLKKNINELAQLKQENLDKLALSNIVMKKNNEHVYDEEHEEHDIYFNKVMDKMHSGDNVKETYESIVDEYEAKLKETENKFHNEYNTAIENIKKCQ